MLGSVALVACTSTTSSPVARVRPGQCGGHDAEIVAATNYEAAWYYGVLDPVPLGFYTVADVTVPEGALSHARDLRPGSAVPMVPVPTVPVPVAPVDAGVLAPLVEAGVATASSAAAASAVAASVGHYFPNGCATASASGNVVTFKLNDCTGPLGLVGSTGTVTATLNVVGNSVQVQLAGNNISANGATVNLSTSGTLTATASGQKTLQASSQTGGTGPDGNNIMHSGMYTLVWPTGTGCATINGTLTGSGTSAGTTTQITNYVACTNKCPQSGMTVSSFKRRQRHALVQRKHQRAVHVEHRHAQREHRARLSVATEVD